MFLIVNGVGNKLIYFSDERRLYGLSADDFSPSLFSEEFENKQQWV